MNYQIVNTGAVPVETAVPTGTAPAAGTYSDSGGDPPSLTMAKPAVRKAPATTAATTAADTYSDSGGDPPSHTVGKPKTHQKGSHLCGNIATPVGVVEGTRKFGTDAHGPNMRFSLSGNADSPCKDDNKRLLVLPKSLGSSASVKQGMGRTNFGMMMNHAGNSARKRKIGGRKIIGAMAVESGVGLASAGFAGVMPVYTGTTQVPLKASASRLRVGHFKPKRCGFNNAVHAPPTEVNPIRVPNKNMDPPLLATADESKEKERVNSLRKGAQEGGVNGFNVGPKYPSQNQRGGIRRMRGPNGSSKGGAVPATVGTRDKVGAPPVAIMLHLFDSTRVTNSLLVAVSRLCDRYNSKGFHWYVNIAASPHSGYLKTMVENLLMGRTTHLDVVISKNKGGDIGGFIQLVKAVSQSRFKYNYCYFFHTKSNNAWRRDLVNSIINLKLETLDSVLDLGLVGSKKHMHKFQYYVGSDYERHIERISGILDVPVSIGESCYFIGGTIFLMNAQVVESMGRMNLDRLYEQLNSLDTVDENWQEIVGRRLKKNLRGANNDYHYRSMYRNSLHSDFMIEHAFERFIGFIIRHLKLKVYGT